MDPKNLIVIMADEHSRKAIGAYGNPIVKTPNIDGLAQQGTRFNSAYTPSPICVPARASFATGKPVREIGAWDNAHPYTGAVESWHHRLRQAGHHVRSIGKLHFRGAPEDDYGFSEAEIPMQVVDGIGDVLGLVRDRTVKRGAADKMAGMAGPGESTYTRYDRDISARTQIFLREEAHKHSDKPWVLFVSFVSPHFPLTAPPEYYYMYDRADLPMPKLYAKAERPDHPYLRDYTDAIAYDSHFRSEDDVRRALAGYYGLCSFIDDQVGLIMQSVAAAGLADDTRIVFTSDHGDNLGARGLWGKSTMYEESVGVPLIVSGPGIPEGAVNEGARSLTDLSRFILSSTGCDAEGFGEIDLMSAEPGAVISEYHATGSRKAAFMLRQGPWKYVHYEDYPPQLFNLEEDPEELYDLAGRPDHADDLRRCRTALLLELDPSRVHNRALADQSALLEKMGGVEKVIARGDFGFSPPPGVTASFAASGNAKV
ncbi:sulfatase-like hydrolase/transferase [Vannielia litorea]|uniref:Choline-sulfatase n=1 Tax=Vannielia litorea TaxID=1217970 RepID=A0A1N6E0G1_9RHOB|nr:sulfatase-like hydrolase/transferase [Vannielia litorea]SIN76457.1 choline-sulfatase [Vannielia litorea]